MKDQRKYESRSDLTIPLLLALAAPVAVIVCVEWLRTVWLTFAIYHLGVCLVAPAIESRLRGRSWREHLALLGLVGPRKAGGATGGGDRTHTRILAITLGLATALVTGAFLLLTRDRFLDAERLQATVTSWGVSPEQILPVLAIMAVLNAPAEELFWRGYLPGRVSEQRSAAARPATTPAVTPAITPAITPATMPPITLTIILPALLYTSYHVVTIGRLVGFGGGATDAAAIGSTIGATLMIAGILGAGLLWGWLRRRTGSVWPALLSHSGAVIAYLAVHLWLLRLTGSGGN